MRTSKEAAVHQREHAVWRLTIAGATRQRIAEELGIAPESVSRIKRRVSLRISQEMTEMIETVRSEQLAQLETIRDEALQAWQRSKRTQRTVTIRQGSGENAGSLGVQGATLRQTEAAGDPRYLDVAIRANAEIRRVLGVDAPVKADITHRHPEVQRMTDDQVAAVLVGIAAGTPVGAVAPALGGPATGYRPEAPETWEALESLQ